MKNSYWYVWGMDNIFQGQNGMIEFCIFEGTENEALNLGADLSDEVINFYDVIQEEIYRTTEEICANEGIPFNKDNDQIWDIYDEVLWETREYGCVELDKRKLPTLDLDKLTEICAEDREDFIDKYMIGN